MYQTPNGGSDSIELGYKKYTIEDFEIKELIGCGGFGKVYLAKDKEDGLKVAIKICQKSLIIKRGLEQSFFNELYHHSQLDHPNIIQLLTYFHCENQLYFVLEYAENSSLFNYKKKRKYGRFDNITAAKYVSQLADALKYCHDVGFLHGDLKPENVLIDSHGDAKLTDFGLSCPLDKAAILDRGFDDGTMEYMAPEMLYKKLYNEKIDHWALGVLCFELLVGKSAFYNRLQAKLIDNIIGNVISFPDFVTDSPRDLISKLLKTDPKSRLPLEDVIKHKWIRDTLEKKAAVEECLHTCSILGETESMEVTNEVTLKSAQELLPSHSVISTIEDI